MILFSSLLSMLFVHPDVVANLQDVLSEFLLLDCFQVVNVVGCSSKKCLLRYMS